jgi:xylulokinase
MTATYLGIDLGTSSVKLLLLDADHRMLVTHSEALEVQRPQALWSEQDPLAWQAAAWRGLDRLAAGHAEWMKAVRGIGLSGQMHGAVLLDEKDAVLRPAILWNDGRSGAACAHLAQREPALERITGNLAMPGFTAPKLVWLAEHEPEVFARTARVLLPKDWLRLQLTGEHVSDMSDAAGTLWLDVAARDWSAAMLAACGLSREHMPRLVEGSAVSGVLHPALARRWNIPLDTQVAGGAGDNAASAVGIGAVEAGQGFLSLGTSGVLFLCNERFSPAPASAVHAFCHALPARWHQMSVMLSAASCLSWLRQLTTLPDEAALLATQATMDTARQAGAPLFLPYLSGERTPHNDPQAQGVFCGLGHGHALADLTYAVLEGVAFGFRDGLQALRCAGGEVQRLALVGGGARSERWAQLLADVLGIELWAPVEAEAGAALGAARLGWLAAGGSPAQVFCPSAIRQVWTPREAMRTQLNERHERFRALYPALRSHFLPVKQD